LSFMATFGLIYLRPVFSLSRRLETFLKRSIIGEDVATTITAQAITLPILLVNFGSYSLASILINGILLWTVPILMIIGGFAALAGLILEPVGRLVAYLALPLLYYFEAIVDSFGSLGSVLTIDQLPFTISLGYYLILLSVIVWIRRK
ncbi:MAG: ComEC/Rec2 family competence protein, partial [Patescibacteria group bacterium]